MATESPAAAAFKPGIASAFLSKRYCANYHTSCAGINAEAYESLRSQVQLLKTEQKQVLGARRAAKQVCNFGVLFHCTFFHFDFPTDNTCSQVNSVH